MVDFAQPSGTIVSQPKPTSSDADAPNTTVYQTQDSAATELTGAGATVNAGADAVKATTVAPSQVAQASTGASIPTTSVTATQVGDAATASIDPNAVKATTYDATKVSGSTPQVTAATSQVSADATVAGQLEKLTAGMSEDNIPNWGKAAYTTAMQVMAARGLGSSTMAGQSAIAALMQAAIPIANQDAQTYAARELANLNNQQQASITNAQLKQQSLLSDQAAENAAKQFNASSQTQVAEFMTNLAATLAQSNAAQVNAMKTFQASETNKMTALSAQLNEQAAATEYTTKANLSQSNAAQMNAVLLANMQQQNQVAEFNSNLQSQREEFNATNALAIEQSNVAWRRTIATNTTADLNAAAKLDAQNQTQLDNTQLNNLWQAYRDYANNLFKAGDDAASRSAAYATEQMRLNEQMNYMAAQQKLAALNNQGAAAATDATKTSSTGGTSGVGGTMTMPDGSKWSYDPSTGLMKRVSDPTGTGTPGGTGATGSTGSTGTGLTGTTSKTYTQQPDGTYKGDDGKTYTRDPSGQFVEYAAPGATGGTGAPGTTGTTGTGGTNPTVGIQSNGTFRDVTGTVWTKGQDGKWYDDKGNSTAGMDDQHHWTSPDGTKWAFAEDGTSYQVMPGLSDADSKKLSDLSAKSDDQLTDEERTARDNLKNYSSAYTMLNNGTGVLLADGNVVSKQEFDNSSIDPMTRTYIQNHYYRMSVRRNPDTGALESYNTGVPDAYAATGIKLGVKIV
jgi:hypothetical protein